MLFAQHPVRRAVGNDGALLEHHQPVDHLGQRREEVLDPDHRDTVGVADLADMIDEAPDFGRREARCHLIDQEKPWPAGQRAGKFNRLALLQREPVGAFCELVA